MNKNMQIIDKLFLRLSNTYGSFWDSMWALNDIAEVKELWAHELRYYSDNLDVYKWALEHLPERPPNLIQFKKLLSEAPPIPQKYIPPAPGVPMPEEIKKKIDLLRKQFTGENHV